MGKDGRNGSGRRGPGGVDGGIPDDGGPDRNPEVSREAFELPIDGTLDLHAFDPREVGELLEDYIAECLAKRIFSLRIVHGKGTGALRETVHAKLKRMEEVESFRLAGEDGGGWGATLVVLKRPGSF